MTILVPGAFLEMRAPIVPWGVSSQGGPFLVRNLGSSVVGSPHRWLKDMASGEVVAVKAFKATDASPPTLTASISKASARHEKSHERGRREKNGGGSGGTRWQRAALSSSERREKKWSRERRDTLAQSGSEQL